MSFASLLDIELKKIRRSKIFMLLFVAVVILWLPAILNTNYNFETDAAIGIASEYNFLVQGFLALAWFMYPASMVVSTVLLKQLERTNKGMLKMLALPISSAKLCLTKFFILLLLAGLQLLLNFGVYYAGAALVSQRFAYNFLLPPLFVLKETGLLFLAAIPMLAFFWLLAVTIQTPIFSIGVGLASVVPSILMINTKYWLFYPMSYPFYLMTAEYCKLAANLGSAEMPLIPWLPIAIGITVSCLILACLRFGQAERNC